MFFTQHIAKLQMSRCTSLTYFIEFVLPLLHSDENPRRMCCWVWQPAFKEDFFREKIIKKILQHFDLFDDYPETDENHKHKESLTHRNRIKPQEFTSFFSLKNHDKL